VAAATVPLTALRADLDRGWPPGTRWVGAGEPGVAKLVQAAGTIVSLPLRSKQPLRLRGTAALTHPAAGLAGSRLRVSVRDGAGERQLWSGRQRRLGSRTLPASLRLEAELSVTGEAELVFATEGTAAGEAIWSGLALEPVAGAPEAVPHRGPAPIAPAQPGAQGNGDAGRCGDGPLFSVLTPVHDPPLDVLEETVASVRAQTFADWELCLLDDGSQDPDVRVALERFAAADPRIHLRRHERAGGIAAATNGALEMATGEYVALLDHDDLLVADALEQVAAVLAEQPGTDMVYSDEELFGAGAPTHVFAKPHWSPDLLRSQMYTCHLGVYRRRLAEEAGGFRPEFDGSQDFDFALRVSERTERIVHVPRVLYRWRAHAGSTAGSAQAKPSAYPAARRAIAEHLERTGVEGEVHFGPWQGIYRVVHRPRSGTRAAVAIVDPAGGEAAALLAAVADEEACGTAAEAIVAPTLAEAVALAGDADVVVICEEPVEPLTRLWLARLVGFAQQPGVAAVGARTLAPGGRVERSGLALAGGLPVPLLLGAGTGDPGPLGVGLLPANVAAVGGVVAVAGDALRRLGGIEAALADLALPDLCLRGIAAGMRVVSTPDVLLRRLAPRPAANDIDALLDFRARWAGEFARDPYFDLSTGWPGVEPAAATG
jgi:glycosyl transferase family 2